MSQSCIAYEVCSMKFKMFDTMAVLFGCMPHVYKDHVGANVYTKHEFTSNGWRFVCDNVRLFIAYPKDL